VQTIPLRIVEQVIKDKELSFAPLAGDAPAREEPVDVKAPALAKTKRSTIERAVLSINKIAE